MDGDGDGDGGDTNVRYRGRAGGSDSPYLSNPSPAPAPEPEPEAARTCSNPLRYSGRQHSACMRRPTTRLVDELRAEEPAPFSPNPKEPARARSTEEGLAMVTVRERESGCVGWGLLASSLLLRCRHSGHTTQRRTVCLASHLSLSLAFAPMPAPHRVLPHCNDCADCHGCSGLQWLQ